MRKALKLLFYEFAWIVAVGSGRIVFPGRVTGRGNLPRRGPYIVAPVHRSFLDWLIVARITRRPLHFMVKAEVWHSRLAGGLAGALGAFPVNRSGVDREALDRARALLSAGESLVLFPEGTRRSGPVVANLQEGVAYLALSCGVPVIPVGIGGSERAMPRGSRIPRPARVEVVIGPPVLSDSSLDVQAGRRRRVSRREMSELSEEIAAAIRACFDEAEKLRGEIGLRARRLG